jgi:histidinol-phosphate phosphatase family protein
MLWPAVFLDKDGTVVENIPYNVDPAKIQLIAGAVDGLRTLHGAGYRLVIVSNQSGVARGLFAEDALASVHEHVRQLLADVGVPLTGFYYCPHHPRGNVAAYTRVCDCRKPACGMLVRAARELNLDLGRSWMIGDLLDDVEAGRTAGCRSLLIDNGYEQEWRLTAQRQPHLKARDLVEAARLILMDRTDGKD